MFKIYDEPRSPNEGVLKINDEPETPNLCRGEFKILDEPKITTWGGASEIYDEPRSPNEGACLGYMMNRNRQMSGRASDL